MNNKMKTNSHQQPNQKKKKKPHKLKQTKQTTRTGTDSHKWTAHGGLLVGNGRRRMGDKIQGIRSIISRHKIHGERSKMV